MGKRKITILEQVAEEIARMAIMGITPEGWTAIEQMQATK